VEAGRAALRDGDIDLTAEGGACDYREETSEPFGLAGLEARPLLAPSRTSSVRSTLHLFRGQAQAVWEQATVAA
jgi:hypothetical protein